MTNHPFGVLYVGVTSDLARRVAQHRAGTGSNFCRRYKLTRLVHAEQHESIAEAIHREKKGLEATVEGRADRECEPEMARFVGRADWRLKGK